MTLCLVTGILEVIGYSTYYIEDDIYDHRKTVLEEIESYDLSDLKQIGEDPVLGWKISPSFNRSSIIDSASDSFRPDFSITSLI